MTLYQFYLFNIFLLILQIMIQNEPFLFCLNAHSEKNQHFAENIICLDVDDNINKTNIHNDNNNNNSKSILRKICFFKKNRRTDSDIEDLISDRKLDGLAQQPRTTFVMYYFSWPIHNK
jgi:hypothetical protein